MRYSLQFFTQYFKQHQQPAYPVLKWGKHRIFPGSVVGFCQPEHSGKTIQALQCLARWLTQYPSSNVFYVELQDQLFRYREQIHPRVIPLRLNGAQSWLETLTVWLKKWRGSVVVVDAVIQPCSAYRPRVWRAFKMLCRQQAAVVVLLSPRANALSGVDFLSFMPLMK
jgi:hypothetical protein